MALAQALSIPAFLMALVGLAFGHSATAGPREDGYDALKNRRSDIAVQLWRPLAEVGDVELQIQLGLLYKYDPDKLVAPNREQSMRWMRIAAESGSLEAALVAKMTPEQAAEAARRPRNGDRTGASSVVAGEFRRGT